MSIQENIWQLEKRIAAAAERAGRSREEVTLVAVTKTVAAEAIREAFEAGIRQFGENRVQEARSKIQQLADWGIRPVWHMVGHLQSNKAKTAAEIFDIIQSIDSVKLADIINRHASRSIPVLLQVNVSGEASKSGFAVTELMPAAEQIARLPRLEIKGLMTIAPLVRDAEEVRPIFRKLRSLRDALGLEHLSMGMSDDFEVAIEEGATIVRIGRAIFGERKG
jgi:hypothetical protein